MGQTRRPPAQSDIEHWEQRLSKGLWVYNLSGAASAWLQSKDGHGSFYFLFILSFLLKFNTCLNRI